MFGCKAAAGGQLLTCWHKPGEVTDTKKKGEWTCFQGKALFYKVWFGITPLDIANLHMVVPRLT